MNKKLFIITILTFLLMLTGCPSGGGVYSASGVSSDEFYGVNSGAYAKEEAYYDSSEMAQYVEEGKYDPETNSFDGRKITYNGNIGFETKEYSKTKSSLETTFAKNEVIIVDSRETDYNDYWYYTNYKRVGTYGKNMSWSVRVPVEKFNSFMQELDGLDAHLSYKNVSSNDMTEIYNDNDTKIKALEVQQERLIELMSQAANVTELLEIEDRLTSIRYQLESLNNSNNKIDYDVKYSIVNIELKEVNKYSSDEYGFFERLKDVFGESWDNFLSKLEDWLFALIYVLPFIALLCLIIFVVNLIRVKQGKEKLSLKKALSKIDFGNVKLNGILKVLLIIIGVIILITILAQTIFY